MKPEKIERFARCIEEKGLKSTSQRDEIARAFFEATGHVSVEELHHTVQKQNRGIGYTTVYRTLKLLSECGLAYERQFGDGQARYEAAAGETHHDHLICLSCGEILEFENKEIEKLQNDVAREYGFEVRHHKMELYGLCRRCRG